MEDGGGRKGGAPSVRKKKEIHYSRKAEVGYEKKRKEILEIFGKGVAEQLFFIFGRERERLNLFPLPPSDSRDGARK